MNGIEYFSIYPIGVKVGLVGISPEEYGRRIEQRRGYIIQLGEITKKCSNCRREKPIRLFENSKGNQQHYCIECNKLLRRLRRQKQKEVTTFITNEVYKVLCRGSGMDKKIVTVRAKSPREARRRMFEIGLIPIEVK
jgi:hypothetical protein